MSEISRISIIARLIPGVILVYIDGMNKTECPYCDGTGIINMPDGEDDYTPEDCPCQAQTPEETSAALLAHLQRVQRAAIPKKPPPRGE